MVHVWNPGCVNRPMANRDDRYAIRLLGYIIGALGASAIYICCLTVSFAFIGPKPLSGLGVAVLFAIWFWLTEGFALALLLVIVPWTLVVWAYPKFRWNGWIYFPASGVVLIFILGCTTASIAPKPLWIEDQTFLEGAAIAAERQGVFFFLAALAFGTCYWWLERQVPRD